MQYTVVSDLNMYVTDLSHRIFFPVLSEWKTITE
jgi:hypothetical protein